MFMLKNFSGRKLHFGVLTFALGLFLGISITMGLSQEGSFKYLDFFHYVYQTISADYVENTEPKSLFYGAINGMLQSLGDPYSRFLNEDDYSEFKQDVTGKFVGVGVEIALKDNEMVVVSPIDDTPAQRAGIKAGDVIIQVNDTMVKDSKFNDVMKLIKGEPHSKVKIAVRREGFTEPLNFDLERLPIKVDSIKYGMIGDTHIGYIKIKHFYAETTADVERALNYFNKEGVKKLVIDLRWNPGGDLDAAIGISELLLPQGSTIVSTRGREGSKIEEVFKSKRKQVYTGELILLVNKGSASSSEILSGAIKDNKRAKLIGQKTFGKALVQRLMDIDPEKTGFTLTIRKYYTPSGALIHKKGITPDIEMTAEEIPESDRKNLTRILNDKLLEGFVKNHKVYNDQSKAQFVAYLKEKGVPISDKTAYFFLKSEITRFTPAPLFDLEFDPELSKAIDLYNGRK